MVGFGRHGPLPESLTFTHSQEEADFVAKRILDELQRGTPAEQNGVLLDGMPHLPSGLPRSLELQRQAFSECSVLPLLVICIKYA
jgi:hypothetical protein